MKKRKFLSLVLAFLMVVSTLVVTPIVTSADSTDDAKVAEGYCFKIGTNYYKTLADAAATVAKGATVTITQIADYSWSGSYANFDKADTDVTLDLNGHTLKRTDTSATGGGGALIWPFGATFTVKNGTMSGATVIDFRDDPTDATAAARTLNIENVTMTAYYMTAILVRASGAPVTVNVKNSTVIGNSTGDGPTVAINGAVNATVNFIGSTLESRANQNNGWGGNVVAAGSAALSAIVNFDAASTVRLACQTTTVAQSAKRYVFLNQDLKVPTFKVNFAEGATVEYSSTGLGNNIAPLLFCNQMSAITDNGIVWKVSGELLHNGGVKLPSFAGSGKVTLWTLNGKRFGADVFHMDGSVTNDATLYTATYENVDPATLTGDEKEVYVNKKYFEMNGTYYADLAAVKAAMSANGTYNVKLLADNPDMASNVYFQLSGIDVTIDLQGHTLNGVAGWSFGIFGKNFTVKNGNIRAGSGFDLRAERDDGASLTLDGVTMYTYLMTGIGLRKPNTTGAKTTVNIKDSEVILTSIDNGPSLVQYEANDAVWNIVNSTIVNANTKSDWLSAMIAVYVSGNKCVWNVDGTSSLVTYNPAANSAFGFRTESGVNFTVNLAAGAQMIFDGNSTNTKILDGSGTAIVDNGAVWKFGKTVMQNGIELPNLSTDANHTSQWTIGSEKFMGGTTAKSTKLTALTVGTHAEILTAIKTDAEAVGFGKVCRIGAEGVIENYYSSLKDAFAAVKAGEEKTITLITDVDSAQISYALSGSKITVDGQNHKVTVNASGNDYWLVFRANSDLTIKNLELHARKGVIYKPGIGKTNTYVLDNVKFYLDTIAGNGNGGIGVKIEQGTSNVTVKDSLLQMMPTNPDGPLFYIMGNQDTSCNLDLINSTLDAGQSASVNENNSAIYILKYDSATGKDDPIGHGPVNIHVDGTSVLKNTSKSAKYAYVISDLGGSATKITFEKGAKVVLDMTSSAATNIGFIRNTGNVTVVDNGAVWQVGGDALKKGVVIPTIPAEGTVIGYSVAGKLAPVSTALYQDSAAVSGTVYTITPVAFTAADFNTRTGASIRLKDPTGLRFEVEVSESFRAALGSSASFGAIIAPTESVKKVSDFTSTALASGKFVTVAATTWADEDAEGVDAFYAALTGIPTDTKSAVTMSMSARGFVTVTYADGTTATFYTAYSEADHARSLYQVASAAFADGLTGNATVNAVLSVGGAE